MKLKNLSLVLMFLAGTLLILPACRMNNGPTAMNNPTVAQLPALLPVQSLPIAWNFDAAGADFGAPLTWTGKGSTSNNGTAALSVSPALVASGYSASASCFGASLAFKGPGQFGNYSYNFPGGINLTNAVSLSMAVSISKVFSSGLGASPYIELALLSGTNDVIQSQTFPAPVVGAWTVYSLSLINNAPNNLADVQQISLDFGTGPEGTTFNTSLVYIDAVTITQLGPTATATATKTATNSPTITNSPTVTSSPTATTSPTNTTSPTSTNTVTSTPTVTSTSTPADIANYNFNLNFTGSDTPSGSFYIISGSGYTTLSLLSSTGLSAPSGEPDVLDIQMGFTTSNNDAQVGCNYMNIGGGTNGFVSGALNFSSLNAVGVRYYVEGAADMSTATYLATTPYIRSGATFFSTGYVGGSPIPGGGAFTMFTTGSWTQASFEPSGATWITDETNVTELGLEVNLASGLSSATYDTLIDYYTIY